MSTTSALSSNLAKTPSFQSVEYPMCQAVWVGSLLKELAVLVAVVDWAVEGLVVGWSVVVCLVGSRLTHLLSI